MAWAIAQKAASFAQNPSSSVQQTWVSNNTAGNLLVAYIVTQGGPTPTIADNNSNVWVTPLLSPVNTNQYAAISYCLSARVSASPPTVTVSATGTFGILGLIEYVSTGAALDTSLGASVTSTIIEVTLTLTTSSDLVVSTLQFPGGGLTVTPAAGNTIEIGAGSFAQALDATPAASGAFVAGGTIASSNVASIMSVAFKAVAAGAGGAGWVNRERRFVNKR